MLIYNVFVAKERKFIVRNFEILSNNYLNESDACHNGKS